MLFGILLLIILSNSSIVSNADHDLGHDTIGLLKVNEPNLKIQEVASGLRLPTHFAFLGLNDILVLEKNNGTVRRVINGDLLPQPLLDVNVAKNGEKGMLGIAVSRNPQHTYIFLYFTQTESSDGGRVLGDMLYRYEFRDNILTDPKLLLHLPSRPGPYHYGGDVTIGPDGFVYLSIGDITGSCEDADSAVSCSNSETKAQNYLHGVEADGRAGILRVTQNGKITRDQGILDSNSSLDRYYLDRYYAYGIRNSYGIDFDPQTGKLWDTENGPEWGDEINLVEAGFNSGWRQVQGIWTVVDGKEKGNLASEKPGNLVDFHGKGKYSTPEFTWNQTVGPAPVKFLNSDKYGKNLKNDMFVADSNFGRIYHFKLNENRTGLLLKGPLVDKIADNDDELKDVVFAEGFGLITDLEVGPDGYLYVLTYGSGKLFRILPEESAS